MKSIATSELKRTFVLVNKNKLSLLACAIADILFFIMYGFFTAPIYQKLVQYMNIIGAYASEALQTATRERQSISMILFQEPIKPFFMDIVLLLLILGATVFMLYIIMQGFIWHTTLKVTGKKMSYMDYLRHFMKANAVWFLLFMIYYLGGFAVSIRNVAIETIAQVKPSNALGIILAVYLAVIAYFAIISYTGLSVKKSFKTGAKKVKQLVPAFLIILVYMLLLNAVLTQILRANMHLGIVLGLIILIPSFVIARVYISLVVQKIK